LNFKIHQKYIDQNNQSVNDVIEYNQNNDTNKTNNDETLIIKELNVTGKNNS